VIVIADSGSTKCDWLLFDPRSSEQVGEASTMGFNPFFHSVDHILEALNGAELFAQHNDNIASVSYFGAGCSSPERCRIVEAALRKYFLRATSVTVQHDLVGAAYATCDGKPGIACILGTGSNMGVFNGRTVVSESTALGFLLGDEGSGSYMGKQLLRDFLYDQIPSQIRQELVEQFGLSKETIFYNVYSRPFPNVYLASFAPFLSTHRHYYYVRKLVRRALTDFLDTHVIPQDDHEILPVHFVGSIAFYYEDILRELAAHKGIQVGKIVKQPVRHIAEFLLHHRDLVEG
jgi:N-acetylglucosamine kinase-like BadF-type ATPase